MLAVQAELNDSQYKHSYPGKFRHQSWIVKARFDPDSEKMTLVEPESRSILLRKEQVWSILEVSEGKLAIAVYNKDILITTEYEVTERLVDPDSGNVEKF